MLDGEMIDEASRKLALVTVARGPRGRPDQDNAVHAESVAAAAGVYGELRQSIVAVVSVPQDGHGRPASRG